MMRQKYVSFHINEEERAVLENVVFLEPFLQDNLAKIKKEKKGYLIKFDADDLFDAISAVEYAKECIVSHRQTSNYHYLSQKLKTFLCLVGEQGQQFGR